MSTISQRSRDCNACRVISGFGLMGCSAYITYHARRFQGASKYSMMVGSSVIFGLGVARLFDLPPFNMAFNSQNQNQT